MKCITQLIIILFLSKSLFAQYDWLKEYDWDTITFEDNDEYLHIDSSENNIWQVCIPNKVFFNSAFSPTKAIVTDSAGYYPNNNHSFFDVLVGEFNDSLYPFSIFIEFRHKFDTDTLKDGGFITVSSDGGNTWANIVNNDILDRWPYWESQNLYTEKDSLSNGEYGFSGRSDGWIKTVFWRHVMLSKNTDYTDDTLIIRFNFISDSIQSDKEGWMIDDIRLYSMDIGGGLEEPGLFKSLKLYPDPVSSFLNILLERPFSFIDIEIFDMNGKEVKKNHFYDTDRIKLSCSDLTSGVYMIRTVLNSKEIYVNKVIIEQ